MSVTRGKKASRSLLESLKAETGNPIAHCVIKSTDSAAQPPKSKHIDTLLRFTFRPEINDLELLNALMERTRQKSWIPVLKALICFHRIMRDGAEPFVKLFANQPGPLQLTGFQDLSSAEGPSCSTFIQSYALYINLKARFVAKKGFDYCHVKSTDQGDSLTSQQPPQLFENLDVLLEQMKQILSFTSDKSSTAIFGNLVVKECASLMFKDILRLWICANNATVNILENFFSYPTKTAKEGLRLYENFVKICNSTDHFVEVCSMVGCSNGKQIPALGEAPKVLLPKLRAHINSGTPVKEKASTRPAAPLDDPFDPRAVSQRPPAPTLNTHSSPDFEADAELPDVDASANPANPFL